MRFVKSFTRAFYSSGLAFASTSTSPESRGSDTISAYSPESVSAINNTAQTSAINSSSFRAIIQSGIDVIERFSRTPSPQLFKVVATPIPDGFNDPERDYQLIVLSFAWGTIKTLLLESASTVGDWKFPTIINQRASPNYLAFDYDDVKLSPTDAIGDMMEEGWSDMFESMQILVPTPGTPEGDVGILHTFVQSFPPPFAVVVEDIDGNVYASDEGLVSILESVQ